jgi:hypothetical protein
LKTFSEKLRLFEEIYRGMEAFMKISIFFKTFSEKLRVFKYILRGREPFLK